jgi:hypothetical protein
MEYRLTALSAEELRPKVQKMAGLAGVHRPVKAEAMHIGSWTTLDDGRRIWRLALQSPDANELRIHFRKFAVGDGRVWLHDGSASETEIMGPYTGNGPGEKGDFWSDFALSDKIVVEFEPSGPVSVADALPFEIFELSHLFPQALSGVFTGLTPEATLAGGSLNAISATSAWHDAAE